MMRYLKYITIVFMSILLSSCLHYDSDKCQNTKFSFFRNNAVACHYEDLEIRNDDFSGKWEKKCSNSIIEEGFYKNGIPIGTWKYYYSNGNIMKQSFYDGIDFFQEIYFYPDAIPLHYIEGRYAVEKSDKFTIIKHRTTKDISYDESGNIICQKNTKFKKIPLFAESGEKIFEYGDDKYITIYEYEYSDTGNFKLLAYIFPLDKANPARYKIKTTALFNLKNKKFSEIEQTNFYGNDIFKVSFEVDQLGSHNIDLKSPDDKVLLRFYSGKLVEHITNKVKADD